MATEQQLNNRKQWAEALRSGRFNQIQDELHNTEGDCCLGVACKIFPQLQPIGDILITVKSFQDVFGLSSPAKYSNFNDKDEMTFEEIANEIDAELNNGN